MDVSPVDPRDISMEWDADCYRVYFWAPDGGSCEEYELTGVADVREVVAWAEGVAAGRVPEIFVRHDQAPERGLIRLCGGRPGQHSHETHVFGPTSPAR